MPSKKVLALVASVLTFVAASCGDTVQIDASATQSDRPGEVSDETGMIDGEEQAQEILAGALRADLELTASVEIVVDGQAEVVVAIRSLDETYVVAPEVTVELSDGVTSGTG